MFGFVIGGGIFCVCVQGNVESNPPGRRVVMSDLRSIIVGVLVAVYWRLPEATGDDPKGKWYEAAVKSVNSRNDTMKIAYLEGGSEEVVNIENEQVVLMENPNIEEPVVPKRGYIRRPTPKCSHGR